MNLAGVYGAIPSEHEAFALLDRALELGNTFWDTAESVEHLPIPVSIAELTMPQRLRFQRRAARQLVCPHGSSIQYLPRFQVRYRNGEGHHEFQGH